MTGLGLSLNMSLRGGSAPAAGGFALTADSWYAAADGDWPVAAHPHVAEGLGVCAYDGKIYTAGGYNGSAYLTSLQSYDPAANTWSTLAVLPAGRAYGILWPFEAEGKIVFAGGYNGSAQTAIYEYDVAGNSWSTLSDVCPDANSFTVCYGAEGSIGIYHSYSRTVEYNAATSEGSRISSIVTGPEPTNEEPEDSRLAGAVLGGFLYSLGGHTSPNDQSKTDRYDIDATSGAGQDWATRAAMPAARARHAAAAALQGRVYVAGGENAGTLQTAIYDYTPGTDSWGSSGTALPTSRRYPAAVTVGGVLYVIGGRDAATTYYATVEAYVPPEGASRPY